MAPLADARCGNHPAMAAVEICSRCGKFVCAECLEYWKEVTPVCAACLPLMGGDAASRRAKLSPFVGALGLLGMAAGFLVPGRRGLEAWAVASPVAMAGLALGVLELRLIRASQSGAKGRGWAMAAVVMGAMGALVFVALVGGFVLFTLRSR